MQTQQDKVAAQLIVKIMRREWEVASEMHRTASVKRAAAIASANEWDQYHNRDGVGSFSQNPFTSSLAHVAENETKASNYLADIKRAYDFCR